MKHEILSLLARARKNTLVRVGTSATMAEIRQCLIIIHQRWPRSYCDFLLQVGSLDLAGDLILGLGKGISDEHSVFARTFHARAVSGLELPAKYAVVYEVGNGDLECLDCGKVKDGECPVVLWMHDHPDASLQKPEIIAKTFTSWLAKKIENAPDIG